MENHKEVRKIDIMKIYTQILHDSNEKATLREAKSTGTNMEE
jgi:hypothetical protein